MMSIKVINKILFYTVFLSILYNQTIYFKNILKNNNIQFHIRFKLQIHWNLISLYNWKLKLNSSNNFSNQQNDNSTTN